MVPYGLENPVNPVPVYIAGFWMIAVCQYFSQTIILVAIHSSTVCPPYFPLADLLCWLGIFMCIFTISADPEMFFTNFIASAVFRLPVSVLAKPFISALDIIFSEWTFVA